MENKKFKVVILLLLKFQKKKLNVCVFNFFISVTFLNNISKKLCRQRKKKQVLKSYNELLVVKN